MTGILSAFNKFFHETRLIKECCTSHISSAFCKNLSVCLQGDEADASKAANKPANVQRENSSSHLLELLGDLSFSVSNLAASV